MEDKRKDLLTAGLYLGDITLALAAVVKELPSYAQDFEMERVIPDAEGLRPAREKVDALLGGVDGLDEIPPELIRGILETAVLKGKFLSASRCLDLLGEREAYVDGRIARAGGKIKAGDSAGAARDIVIASNLSSETCFPLFQYRGPELHAACGTSPEECLTRAALDDAVAKALEYMLEGAKIIDFIMNLDPGERKTLLPHIALERDPYLREFYSGFVKAHREMVEVESDDLRTVGADLKRAAAAVAGLAKSVAADTRMGDEIRSVLEGTGRMASGFVKDFEDVDSLVTDFQLRRVRRRVSNLMESESALRSAEESVKGVGGEAPALSDVLALIGEFRETDLLGKLDEIEAKLLGSQVILLGRSVHSKEHWQYLRELAFKYPASPLMCCIRKLNDRYMVFPRWDGALTVLLKEFLEEAPPAPPS
jgi:hypothetical protein